MTSSCLFSSCNLDNGSRTGAEASDKRLGHSFGSSAVCGGVDSKMALVCSNLSVEISCADVAVAWSLPPACDET